MPHDMSANSAVTSAAENLLPQTVFVKEGKKQAKKKKKKTKEEETKAKH